MKIDRRRTADLNEMELTVIPKSVLEILAVLGEASLARARQERGNEDSPEWIQAYVQLKVAVQAARAALGVSPLVLSVELGDEEAKGARPG